MQFSIFLGIVAVAASMFGWMTTSSAANDDEIGSQFGDSVELFDGKSLEGWNGDPRLWTVRDGVIRGETTDENKAVGNTFLILENKTFGDFSLQMQFRCSESNNSGIQYRSVPIRGEGVSNPWVVRGNQYEIRNEMTLPNVAGFIYDEGGKRGRMCLVGEKAKWTPSGKVQLETLLSQDDFRSIYRMDEWNTARIVAVGSHIQHFLNDRLVMDFWDEDESVRRMDGVIALQLHAGAPMWVEFREIVIRPISK